MGSQPHPVKVGRQPEASFEPHCRGSLKRLSSKSDPGWQDSQAPRLGDQHEQESNRGVGDIASVVRHLHWSAGEDNLNGRSGMALTEGEDL